jgi:hypothetical protein
MKMIALRWSVPLAGRAGRCVCECSAAPTGSASALTFTAVLDPKQRSIPTSGKATIRSSEIDRLFAMEKANGHGMRMETAYARYM